MIRRSVAIVIALSGAAAASPRTVRLAYTGDECGVDDVTSRVRELAGRDPFASDAALRVDVATTGTTATVTIADGDTALGARTLSASSCADLADSVALVIAMSLDRPPPRARARVRARDAEDPPDATLEAATPDEVATRPVRFSVLAGLATDTGGTPAAAVAVRARRARWSGELGFEAMLPATHEMIEVVRGAATFAGCAYFGPLAACALGELGWVTGRGHRLVTATTATTPLAAAGARLAVERELGHGLAVRARLDGRAFLTSTAFTVDDEAVWTTPRAEAWLGIDILAHIP